MDILVKERLARHHDDSLEACAIRLRAARLVSGLSQKDASAESGTSHTAWNNAEKARNYPQLGMMRWLYRAHRIDFNFILAGEFAQLPADVQNIIFEQIGKIDAQHAGDQKPS